MEFRVLGPLEVLHDGRPVPIDRRLSRALLACLLLHANEPVSGDRLIDALWGHAPPRTATASLQNHVSRLRKILGADVIQLEPAGYVLRVDPERFDLTRFERLVDESRGAPPRQRAELLRAALSLWNGRPLEDLAFEEFALEEIVRLGERRLAAVEERIAAELELGRGAELVAELEQLVLASPLRERLRAQLMLALYRDGRQADALAAYRDARRTLMRELGLEPSEELRGLERAILAQDPALAASAGSATDAAPPRVDRRTVTVMFASVALARPDGKPLDAEAFGGAAAACLAQMREASERHGGTTDERSGDVLVTIFGVPKAHEDDALRAVRAAAELRDSLDPGDGLGAALCCGISTGEVVASGGADVRGECVSAARKLLVAARPGEILLAPATVELVRDAVTTEPAGDAQRLAGVVEGAPAIARRLDLPLIGRTEELGRLRAAFERARAERRCELVAIVGEPGIGKTRLARELASSVSDTATVLVGCCVSYGEGATYMPLAEMVRSAVAKPSRQGIARVLAADKDADQVAQRVAELVGLGDAPAAPGEAFWAVRRFVEALARDRPLLLVFEDVHWAEPTLLDLVEYLGEWASARILLVCPSRPELLERRPAWSSFAIELEPLGDDEIAALLGDVAAGTEARIVERAGGNPLFAEQLLALSEEAAETELERAPASVEALLASRLDRLEPVERSVLRRASVVGRRFSRDELELSARDERGLRTLVRKGLVHAAGPDAFRFHHVLVRDVAYRGLPKAERAVLHEGVADRLDLRDDGPDELVGYHLEQAFRYQEQLGPLDEHKHRLAAAAGGRLGRAGINAWKRGDAPAVVNLLDRATSLLPEHDTTRLELLCELGTAAWTRGDVEHAKRTFRAAVDAAKVAGNAPLEFRARIELANLELFVGDADRAADRLLDLAAHAIPLFEELRADMHLARTWLLLSYLHGGLRCDYTASVEAAARAAEIAQRVGWRPAISVQRVAAGLYYGPAAVPDAIERVERLLEDASRGGEAGALGFLAGLEAMRGRFDVARTYTARAQTMYDELGWSIHFATSLAPVVAEIEALAGDHGAAAAALHESCAMLEQTQDRVHLATQAAQLAEALCAQGEWADAETWTQIAEANAAAIDASAQIRWRAARAKVLVSRGAVAEAEIVAREGVELADQTDALNHQAETAIAVAHALHAQGRRREARSWIERAIHLFERKGNVVSARRARTALEELAPA